MPLGIIDTARRLANWQHVQGDDALLALHSMPLPARPAGAGKAWYRQLPSEVRLKIADHLQVTGDAVNDLTFAVTGTHAWFLGPPSRGGTASAVRTATGTEEAAALYIRLVLLKELIAHGAIGAEDVFVEAGFGPNVYFDIKAAGKRDFLRLAEVLYEIRPGRSSVMCHVVNKVFARRREQSVDGEDHAAGSVHRFVEAGATLQSIARLKSRQYAELDARDWPMVGMAFKAKAMRRTRLYFLNLATEFAASIFKKAAIEAHYDLFQATHVIEDGYVSLNELSSLARPLSLVHMGAAGAQLGSPEATGAFRETVEAAEARLRDWTTYIGPHSVGIRKVSFAPFELDSRVVATDLTVSAAQALNLSSSRNYLFINGRASEEGDLDGDGADLAEDEQEASEESGGSVRVLQRKSASAGAVAVWSQATPEAAYEMIAAQGVPADAYTAIKFSHVMNRPTVEHTFQGLDARLQEIADLGRLPVSAEDRRSKTYKTQRALREAIKRCVVELSLKECLVGAKPLDSCALRVDSPACYTLLATRRLNGEVRKQLVSAVDIRIEPVACAGLAGGRLTVTSVRRSPWGNADDAALEFAYEFPFLQPKGAKQIKDGQFWLVDRGANQRLTAWRGNFVPRIITNDRYETFEAALRQMETTHREVTSSGDELPKYYSKGKDVNLLPYYISMLDEEHQQRGESAGSKLAVQDCGPWLRVFVPTAAGLNGDGDSLSGMRDVMVYSGDNEALLDGLLEHPLTHLYLHTMTTGVLVGGENSKMSVLEKLARLALEY